MSTLQLEKGIEKTNGKTNKPKDFGKDSQVTWRDLQGLTWMFDDKI